ncbi:ABC transporter permease [Streptomyces sp. NPDC020845]|uniref:ABC transporter permease n=1 Tax=Streptomyces sp. NPDC020845 TaxID=3365096 RepID=UPI00378F63E0
MLNSKPARSSGAAPGLRLIGGFRALRALWWREVIRLAANRSQVGLMLLNPLLFLLVLGTGLSTMLGATSGTHGYRAYLFPGVLLMAVQMPALSAGMSIVRDREVGLLRAVLVAPVGRSTLLVGKCLGSATAAALQGASLLVFAGFAGLPYEPVLLLALLGELTLVSLTMTALVALAAVWIKRIETFQSALSLAMLPLFFLSGALFSVTGLPVWLTALTLANPLTYAVDALRQTVARSLPADMVTAGPEWAGWAPPLGLELLVMCALGLAALALAARRFSRAS